MGCSCYIFELSCSTNFERQFLSCASTAFRWWYVGPVTSFLPNSTFPYIKTEHLFTSSSIRWHLTAYRAIISSCTRVTANLYTSDSPIANYKPSQYISLNSLDLNVINFGFMQAHIKTRSMYTTGLLFVSHVGGSINKILWIRSEWTMSLSCGRTASWLQINCKPIWCCFALQ